VGLRFPIREDGAVLIPVIVDVALEVDVPRVVQSFLDTVVPGH
jgi:hypothetical protein